MPVRARVPAVVPPGVGPHPLDLHRHQQQRHRRGPRAQVPDTEAQLQHAQGVRDSGAGEPERVRAADGQRAAHGGQTVP